MLTAAVPTQPLRAAQNGLPANAGSPAGSDDIRMTILRDELAAETRRRNATRIDLEAALRSGDAASAQRLREDLTRAEANAAALNREIARVGNPQPRQAPRPPKPTAWWDVYALQNADAPEPIAGRAVPVPASATKRSVQSVQLAWPLPVLATPAPPAPGRLAPDPTAEPSRTRPTDGDHR